MINNAGSKELSLNYRIFFHTFNVEIYTLYSHYSCSFSESIKTKELSYRYTEVTHRQICLIQLYGRNSDKSLVLEIQYWPHRNKGK